MQIEKPLDIIHEIVEDDAIKGSHKILRQGVNISYPRRLECLPPEMIMRRDVNSPKSQTGDL